MRRRFRVVILFLLGLLSTAVLGVVTAIMSAVSLAATALIVPGTGTSMPGPVDNYMQHARDRYIAPFNAMPGPGQCTSDMNCPLVPVNYSASFFPFFFFSGWCVPGRCDTWNASVQTGVTSLEMALSNPQLTGDAVVFGYSQGGAVVSNTLRDIADNPDLLDKISSVVLIGNAYNPDGGIFTRLGFLPTIPFLNVTFGPATPVDLGIPITGIGFEYDPVMYAPKFWGNPLALINMVAAFETVHGYYLTPNGNGPTDPIAYGYTEPEIADILDDECDASPACRLDSEGNEYWMIPAKSLPMYDFILANVGPLAPLLKPFVDFATPVTEVLINLGYDWSGDPGKTRWLSVLPFSPKTNFIRVGVDLIEAIGQGFENAFGGGGSTLIAPADSDTDVLAMSARVAGEDEDATEPLDNNVVEDDATIDDSVVEDDATIDDEDDATIDDEDEATVDDEDDEAVDEEDGATIDDEDDATIDDEDDATVEDEDDATIDDQDEATTDDQDEATTDDENETAGNDNADAPNNAADNDDGDDDDNANANDNANDNDDSGQAAA